MAHSMKPLTARTAFLLAGTAAALGLMTGSSPANVGVAAAVNIDARGTAPGGAPRVLALGNRIVFNERVSTDANGLVQILLLDGTTFTVGPNSDLTIDEFVYNPDTGEAKVVASLTRGAFRFVGARTSQTEGGAIVKTPVGTIGIRGAVSNISYDPQSGSTTAALVAGNKLTITDTDGTQRIVYETGYTAVITRSETGGTTTAVRKSTAAETRVFQQQLAGKPGQNGGSSQQPTDTTVADSGVPASNSGLPDVVPLPPPKPVQSSSIDNVEDDVAQTDTASQQQTRDKVVAGGGTPPPDSGPPPPPEQGLAARTLSAPATYTAYFGYSTDTPGPRGLVGSTAGSDRTGVFFKRSGRLVSDSLGIDLPDLTGTQGDSGLAPFTVSGTAGGSSIGGTAYAGRGDFVAYLTGVNGNASQPFYVIYGTPSDPNVLISTDTGFDLRRYTLTRDPIRPAPVPFFATDLYGELENYNSTDLLLIEPGEADNGEPRMLQTWIDISGTGAGQKSAIGVNTGGLYENEQGNYQLGSGRRGSFRYDAFAGPAITRGGYASIAGGNGAHIFGPNAEHFVLGPTLNPGEADVFGDGIVGQGGFPDTDTGYPGDGKFGTHHVADLVSETPQSELSRTSRLAVGFMNGMVESNTGEVIPVGTYASEVASTNFYMELSATNNSVGAQAQVYDNDDYSGLVDSYLLTFGEFNESYGGNAFIDDETYGARNNNGPDRIVLNTHDGDQIRLDEDDNPGSYLVSGRATPLEGYEMCTDCDFIDWGWWGTDAYYRQNQLPEGTEGNRADIVHMGTWVAGDITNPDDMPFIGSASYSGKVLANISRDGEGGRASYIASGDFDMTWDFSYREGDANISNLDGYYLGGTVSESGSDSQALFVGSLQGGQPCPSECGPTASGSISGAFVNNGQNVAAGVIGGFTFSDATHQTVGSGSFAGTGTATPPID